MNRILQTLAIVGALLGSAVTPAMAQPSAPAANTFSNPNALGLTVSTISGSGITYRRWFENNMGVQVAAIPFLGVNSDGSMGGFLNAGVQAMYAPLKTDSVALYGLLGWGVGVNLSGGQIDSGVAPGLGVDWFLSPNFALTGALGYTFSSTQTSQRVSYALSPGFTIGGMFYF